MKNPLLQTSASDRVNQGGSWYSFASYSRVSNHPWSDASERDDIIGFRLFRTEDKQIKDTLREAHARWQEKLARRAARRRRLGL